MRYTEIYTGKDNKTYFRNHQLALPNQIDLGIYSSVLPASAVIFWAFDETNASTWHTAPQTQFVILLSGAIIIEASGGEQREFHAGDILLANNLQGEGHQTRALRAGTGLLIPKEALGERLRAAFPV